MLSKRHETNFENIVKTMGNLGNDVKVSVPRLAMREATALRQSRQNDGFVMEEKLDGERIQIHKRGQEYRYFSRRDHEYTVSRIEKAPVDCSVISNFRRAVPLWQD